MVGHLQPRSALALAAILLTVAASGLTVMAPTPAWGQAGSAPPTVGVTLRPSQLRLAASERSTTTMVQNRGDVALSLSAAVHLTSTRIPAAGWSVQVERAVLQPGEWAAVTLDMGDAHPSDVSLDVLLAPHGAPGMDTITLRFPIPVEVDAATDRTTLLAVGEALRGSWSTLIHDLIRLW